MANIIFYKFVQYPSLKHSDSSVPCCPHWGKHCRVSETIEDHFQLVSQILQKEKEYLVSLITFINPAV